MKPGRKSFEHFYLTRVALGDCCGCAERVIDWRDIEQAAHTRQQPVDNVASSRTKKAIRRPGALARLAGYLRTKIGLQTTT